MEKEVERKEIGWFVCCNVYFVGDKNGSLEMRRQRFAMRHILRPAKMTTCKCRDLRGATHLLTCSSFLAEVR